MCFLWTEVVSGTLMGVIKSFMVACNNILCPQTVLMVDHEKLPTKPELEWKLLEQGLPLNLSLCSVLHHVALLNMTDGNLNIKKN